MWQVFNTCKSKRPLLVAKAWDDDAGHSYTEGFKVVPFGSYANLTDDGTRDLVFSTGPPAGGAKGRLTLGRPLGSSCADAELRKGKDNTPIGSHGYCLIVGDDISKKFSMAWGEDDIYEYVVTGAAVGGKTLKGKKCDGSLHPGAVLLEFNSEMCTPGCGARLRLTEC
ncbi:hypothetical protein MNEG_5456 [Monoraphidium neglectum]|uniref:Uncharacterized protein n=1 Tax=Monoraphidium neglectum TaxID=145388 RepID=A0A0D2L6C1_9CHLO|nr:hypothetical protein MNEG_5456 [Monoraphidium neglectum]KIZ02504.1 hypothetical protein MNEG_5456 [Monoraphidium neglectum]|eukprot:XP_013901523.1 hypothetical protein MNEG_5456 [Monoraphidium neglectum]